LNGGIAPSGWRTTKCGGGGRWKELSNVVNSFSMPTKPYESTMTIVSPVPVSPFL
jgi:hypothetical protein